MLSSVFPRAPRREPPIRTSSWTSLRVTTPHHCFDSLLNYTGWSPEIIACLENTPEQIIEQRDLYDRRPSVLKSWSKGHVTMLGDAVHPMMPNLGQGGCQAMEDAYALCSVLCDVSDKSQIKGALQDYYQERLWRSAIVQVILPITFGRNL